MKWLGRLLLRLLLVLGVLILLLLAPVAWVELGCRGEADAIASDEPILPPEHWRAEARTLMTWPEWHIVHAYEDYAKVIETGDPHDFGFLRAIRGYWSSLCAVTERSAAHGGVDAPTRQMVHVIGVSFTAELLAKAAYEETLGRAATWLRGDAPAPLDVVSAEQAEAYAAFLTQVPWYRWDFRADAQALRTGATDALRDRERALALGLEYRAKAAYAGLIASAVAATGQDALRLRMIVTSADPAVLEALEGVAVIGARPQGIEIETPRYRALTALLVEMAGQGIDIVEMAGNDDILLTLLAPDDSPAPEGTIASMRRQGFDDTRHLVMLRVPDLSARLREIAAGPMRLEHIHDY